MVWQLPEDTARRHSAFADAIIAGKTPRDAAIEAGYPSKGAFQVGREIASKPEVIALIDTRRSLLPDATDWTPARIVQELADIAKEARDDGQYNVARQCVRDIGEHIGMWPKQAVNVDARQQVLALPEGMSLDELRLLASGEDAHPYIELPESATS